MHIKTKYFEIKKDEAGIVTVLQKNVDSTLKPKIDITKETSYEYNLDDVTELLAAIKTREEQLEGYQTILESMPSEIQGFKKRNRFIFLNGRVFDGVMIDYDGGEEDYRYCFSLELDGEKVTVWKSESEGEHSYGVHKEFYFDKIEKGIEILQEKIEKYALKSVI